MRDIKERLEAMAARAFKSIADAERFGRLFRQLSPNDQLFWDVFATFDVPNFPYQHHLVISRCFKASKLIEQRFRCVLGIWPLTPPSYTCEDAAPTLYHSDVHHFRNWDTPEARENFKKWCDDGDLSFRREIILSCHADVAKLDTLVPREWQTNLKPPERSAMLSVGMKIIELSPVVIIDVNRRESESLWLLLVCPSRSEELSRLRKELQGAVAIVTQFDSA